MKAPDANIVELTWLQLFTAAITGTVTATEPDDDGEIDEDDCAETAAAIADRALPLWIERWHPELAKKPAKGRGKKSDDDDEDDDDDDTSEPDVAPPPPPRARNRRK